MTDYAQQHKTAWEHDAYNFWLQQAGKPSERAKKILADPKAELKKYSAYFDAYQGVRIANICGSCGKKAVPLAVLGAKVTVFDISEDNRRYAMELAAAANVPLHYEVCDVMRIDLDRFGGQFDVVFMEGGVLHYFFDLPAFMRIMYALLRNGGRLICSDFHPFTKICDALELQQPTMSYFSTEIIEGKMAHARFYHEDERAAFPKCPYRKYTVSEIINATLSTGFTLMRFDEHPSWTNPALPGEFTLLAEKRASRNSKR